MKYIYITMVELPTAANKITRLITGFKYTHASVSFDEDLSKMYAFQIKNSKLFLVGGLVEENQSVYFHGKDVALDEMIFRIPVSDANYDKVYRFVQDIKNDKDYIFNHYSALVMFVIGGTKAYKAYHCIEFASEVLSRIDGIKLPKPIHKMHPYDLYQVLKPFMIANRKIRSADFPPKNNTFTQDIKTCVAWKKSAYSVRESLCRALLKRKSKNFDYHQVNFYKSDLIRCKKCKYRKS